MEAGAGFQGGLVAPVALEAGGCSGPWKWEAPEKWEEGDLSGKEMAGVEGAAAAGVAWGQGTGQRAVRLEEDQAEEKTQAERMVEAPEVGRSHGWGEAGRT